MLSESRKMANTDETILIVLLEVIQHTNNRQPTSWEYQKSCETCNFDEKELESILEINVILDGESCNDACRYNHPSIFSGTIQASYWVVLKSVAVDICYHYAACN